MQILDSDGEELFCQQYANYYDSEIGIRGVAVYNIPIGAGATYHIVVSGASYPVNEGDYELKVFAPEYVPLKTSIDMDSNPGLIFEAIEGYQYLIEVGCEGECEYGTLTVMPVPTPINEDCEYATDGGVLSNNESVQFTGNNTGALSDCVLMSNDEPRRHVWIKYTLEDTMDVELDYCGNTNVVDFLRMRGSLTEDCPCVSGSWIDGIHNPNVMIDNCPNMSLILDWPALPPGTYMYPMVVDYRFEGSYVINVTGLLHQRCRDDVLFGQAPTTMFDADWEFITSDVQSGYFAADDFSDVSDTINQLSWWGIYVETDNLEIACEPDSYPFKIIFCEYDINNPFLPGDTAIVYDIDASAEETGHKYSSELIRQKKFTAQLDQPLVMERGWVIIQDRGANDCFFLWQNSGSSGNGVQYDVVAQQWARLFQDLAFCLEFEDGVFISNENSVLPATFELSQNYPNPFNPETVIEYGLAERSKVSIDIYDILGRKIETLVNEEQMPGYYQVTWNAGNLSSGFYFYKIQASDFVETKKMLFLK